MKKTKIAFKVFSLAMVIVGLKIGPTRSITISPKEKDENTEEKTEETV